MCHGINVTCTMYSPSITPSLPPKIAIPLPLVRAALQYTCPAGVSLYRSAATPTTGCSLASTTRAANRPSGYLRPHARVKQATIMTKRPQALGILVGSMLTALR
jgi:hypothetical protein